MVRKLTSEEIHEKVVNRYGQMACSIKDRFKYPTGREGALKVGYNASDLDNVPEDAVASFCGVGNPFSLGDIAPEDRILDVGCGGGMDLIIAGRLAPNGFVSGIDLVPEMAEKARSNAAEAGLTTFEVRVTGSESLPFEDDTFDVVISNGSIYMSPLKEKTFQEIYRVMKKGGRLQFADVVLKDDLPADVMKYFDGWSG